MDWSSDAAVPVPRKRFPWLILVPIGCFVLIGLGGLVMTLFAPVIMEKLDEKLEEALEAIPPRLVRGAEASAQELDILQDRLNLDPPLGEDGEELLWCFFEDGLMEEGCGFLSTQRLASYRPYGDSGNEGGGCESLRDVLEVWFELGTEESPGTAVFITTEEVEELALFLPSEGDLDEAFLEDLDRLCREQADEVYEGLQDYSDELSDDNYDNHDNEEEE